MLSFNQMEFLQDLDKLMMEYHIERFEIVNINNGMEPFIAFYSNGEYLGISDYYNGDFHGIRTYQPEYKIAGGEVKDGN